MSLHSPLCLLSNQVKEIWKGTSFVFVFFLLEQLPKHYLVVSTRSCHRCHLPVVTETDCFNLLNHTEGGFRRIGVKRHAKSWSGSIGEGRGYVWISRRSSIQYAIVHKKFACKLYFQFFAQKQSSDFRRTCKVLRLSYNITM